MSGPGLLGRYRDMLAIPHLPGLLFGWQSTASMAGAAVTAPIVGACLDRFGPAGVAASALAVAVVIVPVTLPGAPGAEAGGEDRDP